MVYQSVCEADTIQTAVIFFFLQLPDLSRLEYLGLRILLLCHRMSDHVSHACTVDFYISSIQYLV